MINELRELEEHEHDDEEEAMREMEAEEMGLPAPPRKDNGRVKKVKVDKDGFDREPELPPLPPGAYVDEEGVDEDEGKKVEGRTYKKKGLKRQTKRVKSEHYHSRPPHITHANIYSETGNIQNYRGGRRRDRKRQREGTAGGGKRRGEQLGLRRRRR